MSEEDWKGNLGDLPILEAVQTGIAVLLKLKGILQEEELKLQL